MTRAAAASPLRLLLPRNHGHAAWIYQSSLGGGLVDGDALELALEVGDAAAALLATQASTKVYRSPGGCTQHTRARVGAGGLLAVVPDPLVCFAGARYAQRAEIDLGPDGSLVWLDALHAGRVARAERWAFARYASNTDVRRGARLVLSERVLLDPAHGPLAARMRGFDALATLVLLGPAVRAAADALRARVAASPLAPDAPVLLAASPADDPGGAVVRLAARTTAGLGHALRECLAFLPALLGDDPMARKW